MKRPFGVILLTVSVLAFAGEASGQSNREKLTRAIALEQTGVMMEAISTYEDYLLDQPGDSGARARLIALLLRLGEKERALPHITILRKQEPTNPQYKQYYELDDVYQKNVIMAQDSDYKTRVKDPNCPPATILEYSRFLRARGDEKGSLDMLKRYLAKKPGDNVVRVDLAKRLSWRKDYKGAQDEASRVVAVDPGNYEANNLLGDLLYWKGDEENALAAYRRAQVSSPGSQEIKRKISKIVDAPGYREKKLTESLKKEPDTKLSLELAKLYLGQNREWEADSLVNRRIAAAPDDDEAKKLSDEIKKRRSERYAKQIKQYQQRLQVAPSDTTVLLALARYYADLPQFDSSISIYNRYLKLYPLNNPIRLERARILMWSGNTSQALQEFRLISVAQPSNGEAELAMAECMIMEDVQVEEAERIFDRQLALYPDSSRIRLGYADALRRQGRYDEARAQYVAVLGRDSTDARAREGIDWLNRDLGPVIRRLEKTVETNPDDLAARRRLAGLYFDIKQYWDAEAQVLYLLEKSPNDKQLKALLEDIRARQRAVRSAALDSLQVQVDARPEDWQKRLELADNLAAIGRIDAAMAHYEMVAAQRPDDVEVRIIMAEIFTAARKLKEAAAIYEELVDRNPGNFDFRFRLALIYSWLADYDRAVEEYEGALRVNPESVEVEIALADIARWRGDPYTAYDAYNRVLAKDPRNKKAREAIASLKGTFFRGGQIYLQDARDSEEFHLRETRVTGSINLSLRMRAQVGWGKVEFSQNDVAMSDEYSELGWFYFGQIDYRIDPLTRAAGQVKYYTFALRKSQSLRLEIEHEFKDSESLNGLVANAYYSSREAIFDLASARRLAAWSAQLRSDKLGIYGRYQNSPKWIGEAEAAFISVTDGNNRTDFWIEYRRILSKLLQVGARYESVSAKRILKPDSTAIEYWAPKNYQTISLVAQLENSFNRWSYKVKGSVGRVLNTNDALRSLSAQLQWRIMQSAYLSAGFLDLATTRVGGRYTYRGYTIALTVER